MESNHESSGSEKNNPGGTSSSGGYTLGVARFASSPSLRGDKIGDTIDRYKLVEEIGEGGCGIVYMAEQQQPFRRQVALKVILPGMATREVILRFEAERQLLASLEHSNIAKIFDANNSQLNLHQTCFNVFEMGKLMELHNA